ncbi:AbrB/MazE/SpoVT family DNA-binding domain-containing protein [Nocardia cyriacigeorgica]|uniref:Transcriptional regulator, AbrB family n=1 Tax=Nocardia cyriacigeorgica TaxID=135487 RepID=A0A4U8WEW5_9NOCA|nr:AbrB/MazE/SpoVT family DNA-binding domain-containing protein [Nocardia cyriacigeorgica]MBF6099609.1 AbrB/MazE/SpoVT family DNA-binding domain-containing protein [Nocardia cyriacigeorgica]MBF6319361.1 AbrB/MazE/SpoVT family DNA-binding domain-containing protein [Nocardia cyriacigeorgica]MBF6533855.1 AbrB/MazE/SpoVT family DNA-binding domain-containing protein [Nocardia cyriacigeorgica]VFB01058.1 transcriptional regulator, AbrB family [Nocardia cyriacigeorgica]
MLLNSKGQVTIPAHLRAKHNLHEGDAIEIVEVGGALQIVRADDAPTRGQRIARRLRGTTSNKDIESLSTDQIMDLLRGE